jgi:FG-GAP-like repeat
MNNLRHHRTIIVFAILLLTTITIVAFDIGDFPVHQQITRKALEQISAMVEGKNRGFSKRAVEQIIGDNTTVDHVSPAYFFPERHFTSEQFTASSSRLITIRERINQLVTLDRPRSNPARTELGIALHGLQDFYSHSNYVQLSLSRGNFDFDRRLGHRVIPNPSYLNFRPCDQNPNFLGPNDGGDLTSAYYSGSPANGCALIPTALAGKCWHGNYRTNTDPYAVGATINPGCSGINIDKPHNDFRAVLHEPAVKYATNASEDYINQVVDQFKDDPSALRAFFDLPSTLAFVVDRSWGKRESLPGTKAFIRSVVANSLPDDSSNNTNDDLGPVNFVLTTYGVSNNSGSNSADLVINTSDPISFLAALDNLQPSREFCEVGKTCYASYPQGVKLALEKSYDSAILHTFDDSGFYQFSNRSGISSVLRQMQRYKIRQQQRLVKGSIYDDPNKPGIEKFSAITGKMQSLSLNSNDKARESTKVENATEAAEELSPGEEIQLIRQSGGDVYFGLDTPTLIAHSQIPEMVTPEWDIRDGEDNGKVKIMAWAGITVNETQLKFPVDSTLKSLTIQMDRSGTATFKILSGDGSEITETSPGVQYIKQDSGSRLIRINQPKPGEWQIKTDPGSFYEINVTGKSPVTLRSFNFVDQNTDVHGGQFAVPGSPVGGTEQMIRAKLTGLGKDLTFYFIDQQGNQVQNLNLTEGNSGDEYKMYLGKTTAPKQLFRFAVRGIDNNGLPFQRIDEVLHTRSTVDVRLDEGNPLKAAQEETFTAKFTVRNYGPEQTINFSANNSQGEIIRIVPANSRLKTDESVKVEVVSKLSGLATLGETFALILRATPATDPNAYNDASLEVPAYNHSSPGIGVSRVEIKSGNTLTAQVIGIGVDDDTPLEKLKAEIKGTLPQGITISNLQNESGTIRADITVGCFLEARTEKILLKITDEDGQSIEAPFEVVIAPATPPVLSSYAVPATIPLEGQVQVVPVQPPSENDQIATLTASAPGFTGSLTGDPKTGILTITNASPLGIHLVTVTARSNCNVVTTRTFTITVTQNTPPKMITAAPLSLQQSTGILSTIAAVSDDGTPAGSLKVTATSIPAGITITNITNTNGTITANVAAAANAFIGNNIVVLTVTDGSGLTTTANFIVAVIVANTTTGTNVKFFSNNTTVTFSNVTTAGNTTINRIDPEQVGVLPNGFVFANGDEVFEIETTAVFSGPITLTFYAGVVTDPVEFSTLLVLQVDGSPKAFIDRTVRAPDTPTPNFDTKLISARVTSLGTFVLAALQTAQDAKWDSRFNLLGVDSGSVSAIAVSGNDVYVGGSFKTVGGVVANGIAKWNGTSWSALGGGVSGGEFGHVDAIAVSGSDVYIGGDFTTAGGISANRIAKWNGSSWSALGSGVSGGVASITTKVNALAASGSNIYVGGNFTTAGGVNTNYIAKWNGSNWSALGTGVRDIGGFNSVVALAVSGNDVYAGGGFKTIGGVSVNGIAKWDGASWSALGSGVDGDIYAIAVNGSNVYVGGGFSTAGGVNNVNSIAKWNGTIWSTLGNGVNSTVRAIAVSDSNVFVGGVFTSAGGSSVNRIAKWDGTRWLALGSGIKRGGFEATVFDLAVKGDELYVGGFFKMAGSKISKNFAIWNTTPTITTPTISTAVALNRQQGSPGIISTIATVSDAETAASSLTVTATTVPTGITIRNITNTNGTITANVAATVSATVGNNTVVLTVTDASGLTATAILIVNITPANNTTTGNNITVTSNNTTVTFSNVTTAGNTTISPIIPAAMGTLPSGYILVNGSLAFEISTTAVFSGAITLTFNVPGVTDTTAFSTLRVLHGEGSPQALVDRTVLSPDTPAPNFATKQISARATSLGQFVIVKSQELAGCATANFANAINFTTGIRPASVAVGDFNADGKPDLAAANSVSDNVSVLMGNGAGGFSSATNFVVGSRPSSVAVGDINNDNKLDLVVANLFANNVSILLGNGAGSFSLATNFAVGSGPISVVIADFDGDGKSDVGTANANSENISILRGNGAGGFSPATNYVTGGRPSSIVSGDFNGDGKLDLAVANIIDDKVSILLGNGVGGFSAFTSVLVIDGPNFVITGDFNIDGKPDLVTANFNSDNISILLGNGTGGFSPATSYAVTTLPTSVAIGDFNGDGKSDLVVAAFNSNVSTLLGNGLGGFSPATNFAVSGTTISVATGDFNSDGKLDFVTADDNSNNVWVLLNSCSGTFSTNTPPTITSISPLSRQQGANGTTSTIAKVTDTETVVSSLTVTATTVPTGITVTSITNTSGTISANVTAAANASIGNNTVILTVTDGGGLTATANLIVNVTPASNTTTGTNVSVTSNNTTVTFSNISTAGNTTITPITPAAAGALPNGYTLANGNLAFEVTTTAVFSGPITLTFNVPSVSDAAVFSTLRVLHGEGTPQALVDRTVLAPDTPAPSFATKQISARVTTLSPFIIASLQSTSICTTASFTAPKNFPANGQQIVVGDFNGDRKADLAIKDPEGRVEILLNNGAGGFEAPTRVIGFGGNVVGDFNGDGKTDLVISYFDPGAVAVVLSDGIGGFTSPTSFATGGFTSSVAVGDFNGDNKADLATANFASGTVSVLLGDGAGGFNTARTFANGSASSTAGAYVFVGDFNGDGKADLATSNNSGMVAVLLNNGAGGFSSPVTTTVPSAPTAVVGDFNGDGKADLATSNLFSDTVSVRFGNGVGGFAAAVNFAVGSRPNSVIVGDFNSDGKTDLASLNTGSVDVSVLLNNGAGGFAAASNFGLGVGVQPISVATTDFNGDNKADIVTANYANSTVSVLFNTNTCIVPPTNTSPAISVPATLTRQQGSNGILSTLANVTDPETLPGNLTVTATTVPTGITVNNIANTNGTITAQIAAGCNAVVGANTIVLTVSDGSATAMANLTVNVTANTPPLLGDYGTVVLEAGTSISAQPSIAPTDNGSIARMFVAAPPGFKGTVTVNPTNAAVTINNAGPAGNYLISVDIVDNCGAGLTRTFRLTVNAAPPPPQTGCAVTQLQQPTNYTTAETPSDVSYGDFNGDGKPDLVTSNYEANAVSVMLNDGNGGFKPAVIYPVGTNPKSVTVGDLNGDGKPDLVVANMVGGDLSILLGNGTGGFTAAPKVTGMSYPVSTAIGDLNGDGKPDLVVANAGSYQTTIMFGKGDGTFTFGFEFFKPEGGLPAAVVTADFDKDGRLDFAVAYNNTNRAIVYFNRAGSYIDEARIFDAGDQPIDMVTGDFNGDSFPDLAVANYASSDITYLTNTKAANFTKSSSAVGRLPRSLAVTDLNGDKLDDLVVASDGTNFVTTLTSNSSGAPTRKDILANVSPSAVTATDFNGDGKPDVIVADYWVNRITTYQGACASAFAPESEALQTLRFVENKFPGDPLSRNNRTRRGDSNRSR